MGEVVLVLVDSLRVVVPGVDDDPVSRIKQDAFDPVLMEAAGVLIIGIEHHKESDVSLEYF